MADANFVLSWSESQNSYFWCHQLHALLRYDENLHLWCDPQIAGQSEFVSFLSNGKFSFANSESSLLIWLCHWKVLRSNSHYDLVVASRANFLWLVYVMWLTCQVPKKKRQWFSPSIPSHTQGQKQKMTNCHIDSKDCFFIDALINNFKQYFFRTMASIIKSQRHNLQFRPGWCRRPQFSTLSRSTL